MTNNKLSRYGLKWNPFAADSPIESFYKTNEMENFIWRIENMSKTGGFALLTGAPGTGKSVTLRVLLQHMEQTPDLTIGVLTRPQGSVPDFYRELGMLFGVELSPHNRWAGSKVLRERWQAHIKSTLCRTLLIIDEAQEMHTAVLNELRLLSSDKLDSASLLTVVLSGDDRLPDKFRCRDLLPLGSRIRVRLHIENSSPENLLTILKHALSAAGHPSLMTKELQQTLCERAIGNLRVLMNMAGELFDMGVKLDVDQLDEKLYLQQFSPTPRTKTAKPER